MLQTLRPMQIVSLTNYHVLNGKILFCGFTVRQKASVNECFGPRKILGTIVFVRLECQNAFSISMTSITIILEDLFLESFLESWFFVGKSNAFQITAARLQLIRPFERYRVYGGKWVNLG